MENHLHLSPGEQAILRRLNTLAYHFCILEQRIMATLADLQTAVAAEDTVIDSAITLLSGLAAAVAALQPNQAAIDALAADITTKTAALSAAVTANTPTP